VNTSIWGRLQRFRIVFGNGTIKEGYGKKLKNSELGRHSPTN
jgi:hypothetical protein